MEAKHGGLLCHSRAQNAHLLNKYYQVPGTTAVNALLTLLLAVRANCGVCVAHTLVPGIQCRIAIETINNQIIGYEHGII